MVVLLAVLFLHFFMGGNNMCRLPHGLKEVLETVTLTTSPVTQRLPLNGVYWSLSMEVFFYFLVFLGLKTGKPVGFLLVISFLIFIQLPKGNPGWKFNALSHELAILNDFNPLFWVGQFPLFLIGYFGFSSILKKSSLGALSVSLLMTFAFLQKVEFIVSVFTLLLLFLSNRFSAKLLGDSMIPNSLSKVGLWSYSLYLIHVPIGVWILLRYRSDAIFHSPVLHPLYDLLVLFCCVVFAAFFYHFVEAPAHKLAQFLSKNPINHLPRYLAKTIMP